MKSEVFFFLKMADLLPLIESALKDTTYCKHFSWYIWRKSLATVFREFIFSIKGFFTMAEMSTANSSVWSNLQQQYNYLFEESRDPRLESVETKNLKNWMNIKFSELMTGCWCPVPGPLQDCVCYITTSSELLDQTTWRTENLSISRTLSLSTTCSRHCSASGSGASMQASGWLEDTTGSVNQWTTQVSWMLTSYINLS